MTEEKQENGETQIRRRKEILTPTLIASLLGLPTYSTPTPTPLRLRVLLDPKGTSDELGRKVYRGAFEHLH